MLFPFFQFYIMNVKFHAFMLLVIFLLITADAVDGGKAKRNQVKEKRKRRT